MNVATYQDLHEQDIALDGLTAAECSLVDRLQARAKSESDWNEFDNFWTAEVANFYRSEGLSRPEMRQTVPYRIGADLSSRLAIAAGLARMPDYRDELDDLIRSRFRTRRAFCQATGLSEDMLSHVMAKRKQLAIDTLATALAKVGYGLKIVPLSRTEADTVVGPTAT